MKTCKYFIYLDLFIFFFGLSNIKINGISDYNWLNSILYIKVNCDIKNSLYIYISINILLEQAATLNSKKNIFIVFFEITF